MNDPVTFALGLALGTTLYQFAKTLIQGLVDLGRARRREALHRWRNEQQAGWRVTLPVGRIEKQPYLGMDIPQFVNRSNDHA